MDLRETSQSYGKNNVRVTKVIRRGARHELMEFSVDIQLHGDFIESYTNGDNSKIIATDSMKNTVYVVAKENDFQSIEEFAVVLAEHFPRTYPQVKATRVDIRQQSWNRIPVSGVPHEHSFVSGGSELHTCSALVPGRGAAVVTGGLTDLLVLKTTNSAFKGFVTDRYRTLKDTDDRIFATSVTATWTFSNNKADFVAAHERARTALLEMFATHMSFSVQQTMYEMAKAALAAAPEIADIRLRLPNKHRILVNLQPFGLENKNEVFVWTDEPYGDINLELRRERS
jgi:urate oxidase